MISAHEIITPNVALNVMCELEPEKTSALQVVGG